MGRFRESGWLALVAVAAGAVAYWPITGSYFHADDFLLLFDAADGRAGELLITPHGGHLLVVRNAVFLVQHALFGAAPDGYYWTAYLTHLVNAALLFAVIRRATGSARLACAGATLWAVSPLNEGALNWYAVYGQVLLTTCVLGALLCLLRLDDGAAGPRAGGLAAALVFAGALCFGTGIGIAAGLALAIGLLIPGRQWRHTRRWFRLLPALLALVYVGLQIGYAVLTGHRHASAAMAIDARTLLLDVPVMTACLLAYGTAGLVGGGWVAALSEHALLIGGAAIVAIGAALGARRDLIGRRLGACALLALGAYGIVAVGRVPTVAALGLTFAQGATWSRYHYAATAIIAIGLCLALSRLRPPAIAADGALLAALLAIGAAVALHPPAIDPRTESRQAVDHMRDAVTRNAAATAPGGTAFVHNRNVYPLNHLLERDSFAGWAALYVIFFPSNTVDGRAVRFVDPDPGVVAAVRARPGSRLAELLVTREEYRAQR